MIYLLSNDIHHGSISISCLLHLLHIGDPLGPSKKGFTWLRWSMVQCTRIIRSCKITFFIKTEVWSRNISKVWYILIQIAEKIAKLFLLDFIAWMTDISASPLQILNRSDRFLVLHSFICLLELPPDETFWPHNKYSTILSKIFEHVARVRGSW